MASTNSEQLLLELVNSARLDPLGDTQRYITSFSPLQSNDPDIQDALNFFQVSGSLLLQQLQALTPAQPLAWNEQLAVAARLHNQAMIAADDQQHQLPGEPSPGQRLLDQGYNWQVNGGATGENIFAFSESPLYAHAGLFVDWGFGTGGMQTPPGHRNNIMGATAISALLREIGIGITAESNPGSHVSPDPVNFPEVGPLVVTQDFGSRGGSGVFVLGVSYTDTNADNFYTIGEGVAGLNVAVGMTNTASAASGGYVLQSAATGAQTITFSGGGLAAPATMTTNFANGSNMKLDVVGGNTLLTSVPGTIGGALTTVRGLGLTGLALTAGAGTQTLIGTKAGDTLDGGPGADAMDGGAGFDFVSYATAGGGVSVFLNGGLGAGSGNDAQGDLYNGVEGAIGSNFADVLVGNDASVLGVVNAMHGGGGDDVIYGEGLDTVTGGDGSDVFFGGSGGTLNLDLAASGIDTVWGSVAGDILNGSTATVPLVFIGAPGADTMSGGSGNDFLYYDNLDTVTGGAGSDWAVATLSPVGVTLNMNAAGFENTWGSPFNDTLSGAGAAATVVIVGDVGNDTITGGNTFDFLYGFGDSDVIIGGPGGDVMLGGPGNDFYHYNNPAEGFDSIFEFVSGSDKFRFTAAAFGKAPGDVLDGTNFKSGAAPAPTAATPTWLYNTGTGILSFDANGIGAGGPVSLAQIFLASAVAAGDIQFVA